MGLNRKLYHPKQLNEPEKVNMSELESLNLNLSLMDSVIKATLEGLAMTEIVPDAVGVSRFMSTPRELSVLVGLHGIRNGNMTMNLSEHTACFLASRFMGEEMTELDDDVIDAVCEIGNMVAGQLKELLLDTDYGFKTISLPALIFGANYNLYHLKNITTVSVTFEINEISIVRIRDKFFTTTIAMMEQ